MSPSRPARVPLRRFLAELRAETVASRLPDVAAQLAYNAMLALFPFLIFLVTILGFLPLDGVVDEVVALLHAMVPAEAAALLDQTVSGVLRHPQPHLLAASIAGSMWAASRGVAALTRALNQAYRVRETRGWPWSRLQSLLITGVSTFLLVVAALTFTIGPRLVERVSEWLGFDGVVVSVWRWLRWPAAVLAISSLLAVLYWACPNVKQRFKLLTPGALTAIPLWITVSLLFKLYVRHIGSFNKTYGALGAGVVLLVWMYLSGFIVLVGGVINAIVERQAPAMTALTEAALDGGAPQKGRQGPPEHAPA